jgi:alpha-glucosidase
MAEPWWRSAVIYQIYPRSFADASGDGIGDLAGVREHLDHLAALGVDAIWFCPWYPSPMADAGYDVADYRDIDPLFGTLADAEALIAQAHEHGIRIIVDVVPNHVSSAHPWFVKALAGDPEYRELFWFRPGRGPAGDQPPTAWTSSFGGQTWSRTAGGEWYLHLFAPEQPDLNWAHPRVRAEFESVLRFWLDRGVDGVRVDSAAMLTKDPALPEVEEGRPHPFVDRDDVHEIYREWRTLLESYPGERALIGELWLPDEGRFTAYLRPDEMHSAFNFDFLCAPWEAGRLRSVIDATLRTHAKVGAPATWVLSNHDVTRHVSRYGRADSSFAFAERGQHHATPLDLELGGVRARAAALLSLALPGAAYIYQGEELGLWEVEDIPDELRQDPMWVRSQHADPGRDGCRVPIPWSGEEPPFGFSRGPGRPWLPQPAEWKDRTVQAQTGDPHSILELYRSALALRRSEPALGDGELRWLPDRPAGVLAFERSPGFTCVVNLSAGAVPLPPGELLLASGPLAEERLPPDTAAWLRS